MMPEPDARLERDGDALVDARERLDGEAQVGVGAALTADSFGNGSPKSPISPICAMISIGRRRSVSYWYAAGATTVSANSRTRFCRSSCSGVRS